MTTFSTDTNTTPAAIGKSLATLMARISQALHAAQSLRPAPKTAQDHLAAAQRREAARARVDNLLR